MTVQQSSGSGLSPEFLDYWGGMAEVENRSCQLAGMCFDCKGKDLHLARRDKFGRPKV